jgi:hypothetical protein
MDIIAISTGTITFSPLENQIGLPRDKEALTDRE